MNSNNNNTMDHQAKITQSTIIIRRTRNRRRRRRTNSTTSCNIKNNTSNTNNSKMIRRTPRSTTTNTEMIIMKLLSRFLRLVLSYIMFLTLSLLLHSSSSLSFCFCHADGAAAPAAAETTTTTTTTTTTKNEDLLVAGGVQDSAFVVTADNELPQSTTTSAGGVGGAGGVGTRTQQQQQQQQPIHTSSSSRTNTHEVVSHTKDAAYRRNQYLRKKKKKGIIRKRETNLASILFPGTTPDMYMPNEEVFIITELVQSKKTHVPFEFYDLPGYCNPTSVIPPMSIVRNTKHFQRNRQRKNLGARLQGIELKPTPYTLEVLHDQTCKSICDVSINPQNVRRLRKLIERQYRVHFTFDTLPMLMRNPDYNYAVRGYPLGFRANRNQYGYHQLVYDNEYYLYNHLKFTITYERVHVNVNSNDNDNNDNDNVGIYITGFDVYPVSIQHEKDACNGNSDSTSSSSSPINDPQTYLPLRVGGSSSELIVKYSYEIEWKESELPWEDRWDVYLIGSPDDDIHFFAIINSLMIVLFLMGAIATIMIRTLRNDILAYNEMSSSSSSSSNNRISSTTRTNDDGVVGGAAGGADMMMMEETGWKLVHGDVFRPPTCYPMFLCVCVGTGIQIGLAFFIVLLIAICTKLINPIKKGHTLSAILFVYVLCGSISGYISARMYKFFCYHNTTTTTTTSGKTTSNNNNNMSNGNYQMNTLLTATALPGTLMGLFTVLNTCLGIVGASTSVSIITLLCIFALWVCVSSPLVFVGSYIGYQQETIAIPTKIKTIPRPIPLDTNIAIYNKPPISCLLGGILPFGSVCIELFFIMSALWLHQIYYVMSFLFAVLLILAMTCCQIGIVMTYLQLCNENYKWYWYSFLNCCTAGIYLFLYSLWFLMSRLELVGFLSVMVYLTYMTMISICFSLFCGSISFIASFYFNKVIYGAVKVD